MRNIGLPEEMTMPILTEDKKIDLLPVEEISASSARPHFLKDQKQSPLTPEVKVGYTYFFSSCDTFPLHLSSIMLPPTNSNAVPIHSSSMGKWVSAFYLLSCTFSHGLVLYGFRHRRYQWL